MWAWRVGAEVINPLTAARLLMTGMVAGHVTCRRTEAGERVTTNGRQPECMRCVRSDTPSPAKASARRGIDVAGGDVVQLVSEGAASCAV